MSTPPIFRFMSMNCAIVILAGISERKVQRLDPVLHADVVDRPLREAVLAAPAPDVDLEVVHRGAAALGVRDRVVVARGVDAGEVPGGNRLSGEAAVGRNPGRNEQRDPRRAARLRRAVPVDRRLLEDRERHGRLRPVGLGQEAVGHLDRVVQTSANICDGISPFVMPGYASETASWPIAPPEPPVLSVKRIGPIVSITRSLAIIAVSAEITGLQ